jgi:hypothetical protein
MELSCHVIIGCPIRKKSELTKILAQKQPDHKEISGMTIREQLLSKQQAIKLDLESEESEKIEAEVYQQIDESLKAGVPVIYEADFIHAKRPARLRLLSHFREKYPEINWIGWYPQLPLKGILEQIPKENHDPIKLIHRWLRKFPPIAAEGFAIVYDLNLKKIIREEVSLKKEVANKIDDINKNIRQSVNNRKNRTQSFQRHRYSRLIDFERLMYLIRLLLHYPGVGNLQTTDPDQIIEVFEEEEQFESELEEICAFLAKTADPIYAADAAAVKDDLQWLKENGLIGIGNIKGELNLEIQENDGISPAQGYGDVEGYADQEPFERLIKIIRLIINYPFIREPSQNSQQTFVTRLQEEGLVNYDCLNSLQKDIEKILKPYEILPNSRLDQGYFAGTAVLSAQDLVKVFRLLETLAKSLENPESLEIYERFQERIEWSKLVNPKTYNYPVRTIHNRNIVDLESLPESAFARKMKDLEEAIEQGQLLELGRVQGSARYQPGPNNFFRAYPLQLVFHNIGWYLGVERYDGEQKGLFQFERVDRLLGNRLNLTRPLKEQKSSLEQLEQLRKSSGGIFLGRNAQQQQQYLKPSEREKAEVTIELWFNDAMFRFISEGTNRFPIEQMKMSKSFNDRLNGENRNLFSLLPSEDANFPHRYQVKLPCWCVEDYDFHRWILGFGGQVKVIAPEALKQAIKDKGNAIAQVYADD